jgi:hypothetical protein
MTRISQQAWGVCGVGLLVMLVAEVLRTMSLPLYLWGAIWVVGWIALAVGVGMAVRHRNGWVATVISIIFTLLGLYFAATGANGTFFAMSSIGVLAVAAEVTLLVQVALGQAPGTRPEPIPASMTFALAGVGAILLAGAFALLANGMPLGFLSFGFSLGLIASSVGFGALTMLRRPAPESPPG